MGFKEIPPVYPELGKKVIPEENDPNELTRRYRQLLESGLENFVELAVQYDIDYKDIEQLTGDAIWLLANKAYPLVKQHACHLAYQELKVLVAFDSILINTEENPFNFMRAEKYDLTTQEVQTIAAFLLRIGHNLLERMSPAERAKY